MGDFVLYSIVGSVVLTLILNFLPLVFPNFANMAMRKNQLGERLSNTKTIVSRG